MVEYTMMKKKDTRELPVHLIGACDSKNLPRGGTESEYELDAGAHNSRSVPHAWCCREEVLMCQQFKFGIVPRMLWVSAAWA